jgi:hypothetical protein
MHKEIMSCKSNLFSRQINNKKQTIGDTYSGPRATQTSDFELQLYHGNSQKWDDFSTILDFDPFWNSFQLSNSIGQCTNSQMDVTDGYTMDPSLVNYCICCGEYSPDPQLSCPLNP